MPLQTYLIVCRSAADIEAMKSIAQHVRGEGGLILMATRQGTLVVAFDDARLPAVKRHPLIEFVGGVTLDARGTAARELHRVFTEHLVLQVRGPGGAK